MKDRVLEAGLDVGRTPFQPARMTADKHRCSFSCGVSKNHAPIHIRSDQGMPPKCGCNLLFALICICALHTAVGQHRADQGLSDLPILRSDLRSGFANAGWKYDRYKELESLDAHRRIVVADLKGPGIIRHLHTTRHFPPELMARGIVLEIRFDDAAEPAVCCPLADFFGNGCNGKATNFSTPLIECAPWSYNCYFPMPFKERAQVALRNDTDRNAMNYSYLEWENLPEWNPQLGYFHSTFQRQLFQLTKDTDQTLFEVQGDGHLIGRQYSVATDEPIFKQFGFVMEGNNEVDIDGRERALDYLGTEDSFTFSWGFRETFAGLRAGMPFVSTGDLNLLSIYRFHDHMPIRFSQKLRWHINWREETGFVTNPAWPNAVARNGCWIDYATVYYWYQNVPGGYTHAPLPPFNELTNLLLRSSARPDPDIAGYLQALEADPKLLNTFDSPDDLKRVRVIDVIKEFPFHIGMPEPKGGHPGNPNPGRSGILAVHPLDGWTPCLVIRHVTLPKDKAKLRLVVSGDPYEAPDRSDFLLRAGVYDGGKITWFKQEVVDAGTPPSPDNWRTLEYNLSAHAGQTVGLVIRVAAGGPKGQWANEEAFFDEISVVSE
jgi:hypothetical protein